jgi:hypothetical protein
MENHKRCEGLRRCVFGAPPKDVTKMKHGLFWCSMCVRNVVVSEQAMVVVGQNVQFYIPIESILFL